MAKTSREYRQEQGELITRSREILKRAEDESRTLTTDENTELAKLDKEMDALEPIIDRYTKQEAREAKRDVPVNKAIRMDPNGNAVADAEDEERALVEDFRKRFGPMGEHIARRSVGNHLAGRNYRTAYDRWLTAPRGSGVTTLTPDEQRALSMGVAAQGGYTVPQEEFIATLIKTADNQSIIRGLARKFQVPQAQSIGAPSLAADPADPDWTTELAVGSEDSTMALGKRQMQPNPLAKYIKISDKLLRASPLGMGQIVQERLAYKTAVAHSTAFNTGTGVSQPLGIYTADTNGISTNRDVDISTSNAYDPDKLISARYTLRQPYWPNARWHFHRNALAQFRRLKSTNNYLWQPGLTVGSPNTLLDFPYVIDEYAPSTVTGITGGYVAVLGDFDSYWIVDALDVRIQRLDELFALTNQVAFIIRSETDGQPVLEDAFVRCKATIS